MSDLAGNALIMIARAKEEYRLKLRMIDNLMQATVSQDPANLSDALAVQNGYLTGFTTTQLDATQLWGERGERAFVTDTVAAALA